jgi:hypothetical protein
LKQRSHRRYRHPENGNWTHTSKIGREKTRLEDEKNQGISITNVGITEGIVEETLRRLMMKGEAVPDETTLDDQMTIDEMVTKIDDEIRAEREQHETEEETRLRKAREENESEEQRRHREALELELAKDFRELRHFRHERDRFENEDQRKARETREAQETREQRQQR